MIRILIADDHAVIREGIRRIVTDAPDVLVAGEASSGHELLERCRTVEHDLVLLDLAMPGTDGLDVIKELRRERPNIPVLVLTVHSEDQYAVRALKAGAAGFLMKDIAPEELVGALRKVAAGGRYLSAEIAEKLIGRLVADTERPPHEKLSDREFHILQMIAAGRSTREIAESLSLSVKTVATYRARIFEKMKMKNTSELTAYAIRNGLTD